MSTIAERVRESEGDGQRERQEGEGEKEKGTQNMEGTGAIKLKTTGDRCKISVSVCGLEIVVSGIITMAHKSESNQSTNVIRQERTNERANQTYCSVCTWPPVHHPTKG